MAGGYIDQGPFAIEIVRQAILMAQSEIQWNLRVEMATDL